MPASTPHDLIREFAAAFNTGDLDGLVGLYEPDATLVLQEGQAITGAEAIRTALGGLLLLKPAYTGEVKAFYERGDIGLLLVAWSLTGTGPDGEPVAISGTSCDIVRRQRDGRWLVLIDNPFGTAYIA